MPRHLVTANASGFDGGVLQGQPTETDERIRALYDRWPGRRSQQQIPEIADDVGEEDLCRAHAIAVYRVGVAAETIEEAMDLTLRVVKAPGAGPPIGAAVDCLWPV